MAIAMTAIGALGHSSTALAPLRRAAISPRSRRPARSLARNASRAKQQLDRRGPSQESTTISGGSNPRPFQRPRRPGAPSFGSRTALLARTVAERRYRRDRHSAPQKTSGAQKAQRAHDAAAGFTLLEAMLSVALMAAIVSALATVTAHWLPNWRRSFADLQRADLLSLGLERIASDVSSAEYVTPNGATPEVLFDGKELSVTFVRSAIGPDSAAASRNHPHRRNYRRPRIRRRAHESAIHAARRRRVARDRDTPSPTRWCWRARLSGSPSAMPDRREPG